MACVISAREWPPASKGLRMMVTVKPCREGGKGAKGGPGIGDGRGKTGRHRCRAPEDRGFGGQRRVVILAPRPAATVSAKRMRRSSSVDCNRSRMPSGSAAWGLPSAFRAPAWISVTATPFCSSMPDMSVCMLMTPMLPAAPVRGRVMRSAREASACGLRSNSFFASNMDFHAMTAELPHRDPGDLHADSQHRVHQEGIGGPHLKRLGKELNHDREKGDAGDWRFAIPQG